MRDVERGIFRVDDALDEVEVLGNEVFAVVYDGDTANIELDIPCLEEVEGSPEYCTSV